MPRSWVENIEHERARLAAAREEVERVVAEARGVVAAIPSPPDIDARIRERLAPLTTVAEQAAGVAHTALQRADAALAAATAIPAPSAPEQILTVFRALARILAVRVLLFLSLAGTFVLALMAMSKESWMGMAMAVAFALLTIGPLAWLEVMGRRPPPTPTAPD